MKFNAEQLKSIKHRVGPGLVIAVPGSGKTTVLLERLHYLVNELGVHPKKLLTISFSRATVETMKRRYRDRYPDEKMLPIFSTIHGLGFRIIRDYSRKKNIDYQLIETGDKHHNKYALLGEIYRQYNHRSITEEKMEQLLDGLSVMANEELSPEQVQEKRRIDIHHFDEIVESYQDYKHQHKLLDFNDMLTLSKEILTMDSGIRRKYQKQYDYIQVDEGQDTSRVQMKLLDLIAKPKYNVLIVADDDQAIYSFRGASPKGLFRWRDEHDDIKMYFLSTNYRSTPAIVEEATGLIKKNQLRFKKEIKAFKGRGEKVSLVAVEDLQRQYDLVIDGIKKSSSKDIGILYRSNYSAIGLLEALEREDIPFSISDRRITFLNHWLVKDLKSFFDLAYDRGDKGALLRIYYKMPGYISKTQMEWLMAQPPTDDVFLLLMNCPHSPNYQQKYLEELSAHFDALVKRSVSRGIQIILYQLEYESFMLEYEQKYARTGVQGSYYLETIREMGKYYTNAMLLWGRLEYLNDLIKKGHESEYGVSLTTAHSAKGLEYDEVYVIDVATGHFPYRDSVVDVELMEEERRLFYVAMTRAKEKLTIIWPKSIGSESSFFRALRN